MALVLEGAADRTVGHFGGVPACYHVDDGTFSASRLAEDDDVFLDRIS